MAQQLVELGVVPEVADPDDPKVQDELLAKLETIRENAVAAGRKALDGAQKFQAAYQASSARALRLMPELRDPKSEQEQAAARGDPGCAVDQRAFRTGRRRRCARCWASCTSASWRRRPRAKMAKPAVKPPAVPKSQATLPAGEVGGDDVERRRAFGDGDERAVADYTRKHVLRAMAVNK